YKQKSPKFDLRSLHDHGRVSVRMSTYPSVLHELPTTLGAQKVSSVSQESFYKLIHDLRQPLSAIASLAYCLELTVPAEQTQARLYISRLNQLVADASYTLSSAAASGGAALI